LSGNRAGHGGVVCRTGDRRRLGSVRHDLHGHRGGAHAVRSPRSGALELAPHCVAQRFTGAGGRLAVLVDCHGSAGIGVHVVSGPHAPECGSRNLVGGGRARPAHIAGSVLFSSGGAVARSEPRVLAGSSRADVWDGGGVLGVAEAIGAEQSGAGARVAGRVSGAWAVATGALLWQHSPAVGGDVVPRARVRDSALSGSRLPTGGASLPVCFCGGDLRRPAGDTTSQPGSSMRLRAACGLRSLESEPVGYGRTRRVSLAGTSSGRRRSGVTYRQVISV